MDSSGSSDTLKLREAYAKALNQKSNNDDVTFGLDTSYNEAKAKTKDIGSGEIILSLGIAIVLGIAAYLIYTYINKKKSSETPPSSSTTAKLSVSTSTVTLNLETLSDYLS
ncbi:MAG: hypothetical protein ACP5MB_06345, partial [bacterium]